MLATVLITCTYREKDCAKSKVDDLGLEISALKSELADMSALNASLQAKVDSLQTDEANSNKELSSDYDSSDRNLHQVEMLREQVSESSFSVINSLRSSSTAINLIFVLNRPLFCV